MATHFVTFLGRAAADASGDPTDEPRRHYRFADEWVSPPTRLFARAALEWLDRGTERPDRIVVLGTAGSMWDALLTELVDGVAATDLWTDVHAAAATHAATPAQVAQVADTLSAAGGRPVACHVVPAGLTDAEQHAVLAAMSQGVHRRDRLVLDLTHRYRHLPLAGLVGASLLAYDREARLADVWYADLHNTVGEPAAHPVSSLRPLLDVQAWGRAFAVLRESGRYASIAALLGEHPAAEPLEDTGFFLATNQIPEARRSGEAALAALRADGSGDALLAIICDDLIASLDWVDEPRIWDRMLDVARRALAGGDHLEAVTLTQEAVYWAAAGAFWNREKPQESDALEALKHQILGSLRGRRLEVDKFHRLRKLRNAVAHGLKPSGRGAGEVRRVLSSAAVYRAELGELIDWVEQLAERWTKRPPEHRGRRSPRARRGGPPPA